MSGSGHDPFIDVKAEKLAVRIVRPKARELFIDIDGPVSLGVFRRAERFFLEMGLHKGTVMTESKTPGNFHAVVTWIRKLTEYERVGLQAIYGSDLKREMLGWQGLEAGHDDVTCFFEKKDGT